MRFMGFGCLLSIVLFVTVSRAVAAPENTTFFVSPAGNDGWSGSSREPKAGKTDGPFATPARARDAVRQLKQQQGGTLKTPVTIELRGGTYVLSEPLILNPSDSGVEQAPVTWSATVGEKPILSGGRAITGWQPAELNGRKVWTAAAPPANPHDPNHGFFRQMWTADGKRLIRSRFPDTGYLAITEVPGSKSVDENWTQGRTQFRYKAGDLPNGVEKIAGTGAEAVVMSRWVESRSVVASIDPQKQLVTDVSPSVFSSARAIILS